MARQLRGAGLQRLNKLLARPLPTGRAAAFTSHFVSLSCASLQSLRVHHPPTLRMR